MLKLPTSEVGSYLIFRFGQIDLPERVIDAARGLKRDTSGSRPNPWRTIDGTYRDRSR